jgi:hypothetical protein
VLRDGTEQRILAEELVPGDVMLLTEGDRISADGRLVDEADVVMTLRSEYRQKGAVIREAEERAPAQVVPEQDLLGKPFLVFWPLARVGLIR